MKLEAAAAVANGVNALGASTAGAVVQAIKTAAMSKPDRFDTSLMTALATLAEVAVGEYTGTGAALDVSLPFDPVFVLVYNKTDGDVVGLAFNTANAGTTNATIVLATAQEASQGINFGAAAAKKFTLGTSAVTNENAKVYQYLAIGY